MNEAVQLREARRGDLSAIVALLADDRLGSGREGPVDPLPESYVRAFEALDADPNHRLMLAVDADEVVAVLQLSFLPNLTYRGSWRAQIEGVRVVASQRGKGLGRRMMQAAIEQARERGCAMVQLTTDTARPAALAFYEGLGFVASHHGMKLHLERG